jgi:hypothetical protein
MSFVWEDNHTTDRLFEYIQAERSRLHPFCMLKQHARFDICFKMRELLEEGFESEDEFQAAIEMLLDKYHDGPHNDPDEWYESRK